MSAIVELRSKARETIPGRLIFALFSLAVLLLPYDAIQYLPSTYRPLSLVPLVLIVLLCVKDFLHIGLGRSVGFLTAFSAYSIIITFVDYAVFQTKGNYLDCFATIIIGYFVFFVAYGCFTTKARMVNVREYVLWFSRLVSKAYLIPMVVGLLQAACSFGVLPHGVASTIATIFGSHQVGRIALTSFEASWASVQMLFAMPLIFIDYLNSRQRLPLVELVVFAVLFVVNASAQGFVTLAVGLLLYPIFLSFVRNDVLAFVKKFIPIILCIVLLVVGFQTFVQVFPVPNYVKTRIVNFVSLDGLIRRDGSSFIRICYPLISINMWMDSPIFGLGGGSFSGMFADYLANMFPWAINNGFTEVYANYIGALEPSACNIYTRTLGEFGLVGFILYVAFIGACLRGLKRFQCLQSHEFSCLIIWASILVTIPIQFQSYCYVPTLMGLAFISSVFSCRREEDMPDSDLGKGRS